TFRIVGIERLVNTAQNDLKWYPSVFPCLHQSPIHGRNKEGLAATPYKLFLNLREVVEVTLWFEAVFRVGFRRFHVAHSRSSAVLPVQTSGVNSLMTAPSTVSSCSRTTANLASPSFSRVAIARAASSSSRCRTFAMRSRSVAGTASQFRRSGAGSAIGSSGFFLSAVIKDAKLGTGCTRSRRNPSRIMCFISESLSDFIVVKTSSSAGVHVESARSQ